MPKSKFVKDIFRRARPQTGKGVPSYFEDDIPGGPRMGDMIVGGRRKTDPQPIGVPRRPNTSWGGLNRGGRRASDRIQGERKPGDIFDTYTDGGWHGLGPSIGGDFRDHGIGVDFRRGHPMYGMPGPTQGLGRPASPPRGARKSKAKKAKPRIRLKPKK